MLFTGHSQHTIDPKLRLAVPAKYRNQWDPARDGAAWFCIPWPTGHLRLYTEGRFAHMAEQGESSLAISNEQAELESRLYGFAERLEMDTAGRITLPRSHLQLAGLGTEVVVVGARTRLEVHDRAAFEASLDERFRQLPALDEAIGRRGRERPGAD